MDDGLEKTFVAHDNGSLFSCGNSIVLAEPSGNISRLDVLSCSADIIDFLGLGEVFVDIAIHGIQFVRELLKILTDIMPSLISFHVVVVEVPVEKRLAILLQP